MFRLPIVLLYLTFSGLSAGAARAQPAESADDDMQIIDDGQFEAELPDLDPQAVDAPLPPVEIPAAPRTDAPPTDPGTPADTAIPALDDGTAVELLPDVPIEDDGLARPLVPLTGFEVRPAAAPTEEVAAADEEIRYRVVIDGFDGTGLLDRFRDASTLVEGDGTAANAATLGVRAEQDAEFAITLLRSLGYYDADASADIILPPEADGRYRVDVIATPGQRYEFSSVKVLGEDKAIPPRLASDRLELDVGDPIATDQILSAEATMSLVFPFNGYPFAEVGQRDILLDSETKTGDYTLPIELGPRASFRDVRVEGDPVFSAEHVAILARYEEGDLYDVRLQDDLREALIATSLLSSVSIEPERTEETAPDGTEYVDLVVDLAEGPARAISGDVGFETGRGFTLTGRWAHRNLFPPEGAGEVTATLGTNEQGLGFLFRRSNAGRRDRSALLGLDFRNQDFEAFNARSASLVGRIAYESTPIWQKRITYAYGFELIASDETTFDPDTGEDPKNTFIIGALPAQVGYDTSDNLLDPTRGFRATLRASPEASLQGGDFDPYGRVLFDLSAYQKLYEGETDSFVLAGRTRFGSIFGIPLFEIAPSRRYYAGGGGSVRGFGFQDIGPRDTDLDPIGGRSVNEFAIEGRYRFGDFGVVAFVDSGQVYDEEIPQLSDLEFAAGFGARYYTNFGPLRFDIGFPLDPDPGVSDFGILISIGQAF